MTPASEVLQVLRNYLVTNDLHAEISVREPETASGSVEVSLVPEKIAAASLLVLVSPFPGGRYGIFVYIGHDERPIEIEGPLNINRPESRPALEELMDVLDSVTGGEVYEEFSADGHSLGCNIYDPEHRPGFDSPSAVRRQMFESWT